MMRTDQNEIDNLYLHLGIEDKIENKMIRNTLNTGNIFMKYKSGIATASSVNLHPIKFQQENH